LKIFSSVKVGTIFVKKKKKGLNVILYDGINVTTNRGALGLFYFELIKSILLLM